MRVLFVHQNFPGQYRHIVEALAQQGAHQLVGLGIEACSEPLPKGVHYIRYQPKRGNTAAIHPLVLETETKCIRGEACAEAACKLKQQGFNPDLICAHPGWGESLFLKDIWPQAPLLSYQEFFYRAFGFDCAFDPEFGSETKTSWQTCATVRMKTAFMHLVLEASDWNITPTAFQRSSFPKVWQTWMSTIHDGIDTERASPAPQQNPLTLPDGTVIAVEEPVVTYVNRAIEPYRGCHTFLRSIPALQQQAPNSRIVIVGDPSGDSYGPAPTAYGTWKEQFLDEIANTYDPTRVHFTGSLTYEKYLEVLQHSSVHVYLTYPFVLSWSLLEAMSCGCAVVGSATAPVQELIQHEHNGLLTDFFDPAALADAIAHLLKERSLAKQLGKAARETIVNDYSLQACLPRQLALLQLVASRSLSH